MEFQDLHLFVDVMGVSLVVRRRSSIRVWIRQSFVCHESDNVILENDKLLQRLQGGVLRPLRHLQGNADVGSGNTQQQLRFKLNFW